MGPVSIYSEFSALALRKLTLEESLKTQALDDEKFLNKKIDVWNINISKYPKLKHFNKNIKISLKLYMSRFNNIVIDFYVNDHPLFEIHPAKSGFISTIIAGLTIGILGSSVSVISDNEELSKKAVVNELSGLLSKEMKDLKKQIKDLEERVKKQEKLNAGLK